MSSKRLQAATQDRAVAIGIAVVTLVVAGLVSRQVLEANHGRPGLALDDSYIHLQYARALARGAPLEFSVGAPPVAGSTSWLWPLLLAPFAIFGLVDTSLIWPTWALAWTAYGLLAWEVYRVTRGLLSEPARIWLVISSCGFGGHIWFAGSGMEGVPFGWLLLRSARRAAEWRDPECRVSLAELVVLAWLAPLMRPEGFLASLLLAVTLLRGPALRQRAWGLLALLGPCLPGLGNLIFSGELATTTQSVKWLPANPYQAGGQIYWSLLANLRLLFGTLLNGEIWSAEFLPRGSAVVLWLALPALLLQGVRKKQLWRALCLVSIGVGLLLPAAYDTFLWNRLRYLWPFIMPWFIGVAAQLELASAGLGRISPKLSYLKYPAAIAITAGLLQRLPLCARDLAASARAISDQHVALGRWAREHLPENARIGVNDTGAIAYFSERRIFDIVGLTTRGEAAYWVAGAGSRFEHYEHLSRSELPTHFIVYPHWLALPPLLGKELTRRSLPDATILGGTTMIAYEAEYGALGSGEAPSEWPLRRVLDQLDVADLESERAHAYELLDARQIDNQIVESYLEGPVDGARHNRYAERFKLLLTPGMALLARLGADAETTVRVSIDGQEAASWQLRAEPWQEFALTVLPEQSAPRTSPPADNGPPASTPSVIELSADGAFSALHYWSAELD